MPFKTVDTLRVRCGAQYLATVMQSRDPGAGCLWIAIPERIDVGILHPARGEVEFGINGLHRARGLTRPTIDAFIWIDVELAILPSLKMNTRHGQTRTQAWSRTSMQGAAITKGIPLPFLLWFKTAHKITPGVCAYRTSQVRRAWEELRCGGDEQKASDSGQGTEKPQPQEVGVKHHDNATGTLPLERLPVENQAGFLARGMCLLSAPSQGRMPQWYPQISFRSQLRGSDGFPPSSLLTASGCEATAFFDS